MEARRDISEGMTVYTRDGEKLGKVVAVDDTGLFVEKGFFFPREYGFRYADVAEVREDGVHLQLDKGAVSTAMVERAGRVERSRPGAVSEDIRSKPGHDEAVSMPVVGTPEPTSPGEIRRATDDIELIPREKSDVNREAEVRRSDRRDPDDHV